MPVLQACGYGAGRDVRGRNTLSRKESRFDLSSRPSGGKSTADSRYGHVAHISYSYSV